MPGGAVCARESGPHLGPDIVANDYTGWWVSLAGPVIGAVIAIIIGLVRELPDRAERDAAHGSALPMLGANGRRPSDLALSDLAGR